MRIQKKQSPILSIFFVAVILIVILNPEWAVLAAPFFKALASKPSEYKGVKYRGINMAGCDFDSFDPPLLSNIDYFGGQGMNIARVPFKWESLQPSLSQPVNFEVGNALTYAKLVDGLTKKGYMVLIDVHNYMRYNGGIIGQQGSGVTIQNYVNLCIAIGKRFGGNSNIMVDLMNEPYGLATESVVEIYNAAMPAMRKTGYKGPFYLEGNAWSGMHDWFDSVGGYTPNSEVFVPHRINDTHYVINFHQYLDPDSSGSGTDDCVDPSTVVAHTGINRAADWLRETGQLGAVTETGGIETDHCVQDMDTFLSAIEANPSNTTHRGGFIAWTLWAGGSFGQDYKLDLNPNPNGSEKRQMAEGVDGKHITKPPSFK